MGHARTIQREALDIGATAGGHQEALPVRLAFGAGRDDESCGLLSCGDRATPKPLDAFPLEDALKNASRLGVVVGQQSRRHDRDLAAQTLVGLRELHSERTATDHDQRCRQAWALEDGVVREVRCAG